MTSTTTQQPTVYIVIDGSAIAYEESGEILEAVDFDASGKPIWSEAGVCDYRGGGGQEGFRLLKEALDAAEANAAMMVVGGMDEIVRVPKQHNCDENAVPYVSDGPLGHGFECGICGKFLQAG